MTQINGGTSHGGSNGSGALDTQIKDLAFACVRFVEAKTGVKLDFTPETLPLLDHYLAEARAVLGDAATADKAREPAEIVVRAAGAYLGEVMRQRYACWWRVTPEDRHRLEFRDVFLKVYPMDLVREALEGADDTREPLGAFEIDEEDRMLLEARLAELPAVSVEEYLAPSTRVEVLDILMDAARARVEGPEGSPLALEPEDYDP